MGNHLMQQMWEGMNEVRSYGTPSSLHQKTKQHILCMAVVLWHRLRSTRIAAARRRRKRLQGVLALLHQHGEGRVLYTQLILAVPLLRLYSNPEACLKREFRLTRQSVTLLRQLIHNPRNHGWGQELEVLIFLYSLAHGFSFSGVARAFGVPKSTVHRVIHRVVGEIKAKLGAMISLPSSDELPNICDGFCQLGQSQVFGSAAGALGGCHIHIKPPGNLHQEDYLNYKLVYSIQLQAICDATGRFLDIFVGYPGSVLDATVLRNSPIYSQALYPPSGFCLLAHGGYPCLEKPIAIITPYKLPLDGQVQRSYNRHHSRAHSVVEQAFGLMKARWRTTFCKALEVNPAFAPDIVACCAFLHNLCLTTNDVIELEDTVFPDSDIQHTLGEQEASGHQLRDKMASAFLCTPELLPKHLQEHDYQ